MKFTVTPELALLLKTVRTQNGISAKELAEHIGRSPSYLSKLENGDIKTIQQADLTDILSFIHRGESFYDVVLPNIMRVLGTFQDPSRILSQTWLLQYDTVDRLVCVPEKLGAEMAHRMKTLNISAHELANLINSNPDTSLPPATPSNQILEIEHGELRRISLKVRVTSEDIEGMLDHRDASTPYIIAHATLFMLIKLEKYGRGDYKMPPEESSAVLRETALLLDRFDIHSVTGFSHMVSSSDFVASQILSIRAFGSVDSEIVCSIIDAFREALDHDGMDTVQQLDALSRNLSWDPAFTLKMLGLPFYRLDNLSFHQKSSMLKDITDILERYDAMPDYERRLERY